MDGKRGFLIGVQKLQSVFIIVSFVIGYPDSPNLTAPRILEFRTDIIIVLFDWNQSQHHRNHISYHVDVIPQHLVHNMITLTSSASAQLQLSYNTYYNVSITAILCGQRNATIIVSLDFGESFVNYF